VNWRFLRIEAIEVLHYQQIVRFGGSPGLRDRGLLESAVVRAENRALYDPTATAGQLAGALGWGLIKNHAFVDGNKRIGLVSMVTFLHINGFRLTCSAEEETAMVLRAASSAITEEEWTAWVERSIAPTSE
jgi:death-on-curing protein